MSSTKEDLRARLAAVNAARPQMSVEDSEEAAIREQIAAAETRNREERTRIRRLLLEREYDRLRASLSDEVALEIVDTEIASPGSGSYILRSAPEEIAEQFDRAIKSNPDGATEKDTRDFVLGCIVYPDPEKNGEAIRDIFDRLHYLPRTLSNEALRITGLVTDLRRRKS